MSALARRGVCAALLTCLIVTASTAQDAPPPDAPAAPVPLERRKALLEGTHVFRRILFDHGCTPLESFEDLKEAPQRTILIILGDLDHIEDVPGGVADFVRKGGAVMLASDRPVKHPDSRRQLRAISGVSINSETLVSMNHVYKGIPYCPLLLPDLNATPRLLFDEGNDFGPLPFNVATNVPSHLLLDQRHLPVLAYLPPQSRYDVRDRLVFPANRPAPFLVAGDVGDGRVLVAADHSIFINEMMLPEDVQNVEFSYNCVRFLSGDRPRDRVLFLDEGGIQTTFEVPLKSANLPFDEMLKWIEDNRNVLIKTGETGLIRLERNNAFNNAVGRFLERIDNPPGRLFAAVATLFTIALCVFGMIRLGIFGRFSHDKRTSPLAHAVGRSLPAGPLAHQRNHALLRLGRLNEPAGQVARRWLLSQGLSLPADPSPGEPPVTVKAGWWAGRGLRRRLNRVWLLAAGRSREAITSAALWQFQRELDALTASRQRGEWEPNAKQRGGAA